MILGTGVSGNVGTELARILMARRVPFRAMVRSPEAVRSAGALAGAEIVASDFNRRRVDGGRPGRDQPGVSADSIV